MIIFHQNYCETTIFETSKYTVYLAIEIENQINSVWESPVDGWVKIKSDGALTGGHANGGVVPNPYDSTTTTPITTIFKL